MRKFIWSVWIKLKFNPSTPCMIKVGYSNFDINTPFRYNQIQQLKDSIQYQREVIVVYISQLIICSLGCLGPLK